MITISEYQSHLSAWGHYAEPKELRILKYPKAFFPGQTINLNATKGPNGTAVIFSDGSVLYTGTDQGLLPMLEGVSVWSEPAEGTVIPNDLEWVRIRAAYRTRKGKTLTAQVSVPVAIPSELRFVFPYEPKTYADQEKGVNEGAYYNMQATWLDGTKQGFKSRFAPDAELAVYWKTRQDELIAVETISEHSEGTLNLQIPFGYSFDPDAGTIYKMPEKTDARTIIRYREIVIYDGDDNPIMPGGEELELENSSGVLRATYSIGGFNLVAETYFETNPVVQWGFYKMPTTYVGDQTVNLNINDHSLIVFKDGTSIIGQGTTEGDEAVWYSVWFRRRRVDQSWNDYAEETVRFADGLEGTVGQYCFYTSSDQYSNLQKVSNKRKYICSGGTITWTDKPI